jgi:hypothetical protein
MMTAGKRMLRAVALVLAAVGVPAMAYTYNLLSPTRHWPSVPVQICVKSPGHVSITADDLDGGVTATIQALNGNSVLAGTGWNFTAAGTVVNAVSCDTSWALGDGIPTIAFKEMIPGTCTGSCLAATFIGFYDCSPPLPDGHCAIDDSDVETRSQKADRWGGPYYSLYEPCRRGKEWNIEAIMVHEVGHVLGIHHSNVVGATMYPSLSPCTSSTAVITDDDSAALDELY